jgi:hypothetical protein
MTSFIAKLAAEAYAGNASKSNERTMNIFWYLMPEA